MLEDIVTNLANHLATGQIPKPYRRGSWRPIGHMRPSSPLLDSVRDLFEGYDQLSKDFNTSFQGNAKLMCDVAFNVIGQSMSGKSESGIRKIYGVRAILAIRSRVFLEMLYGFSPAGANCSPSPAPPITPAPEQRKQSRSGPEKKRRSSVTAETIHKIAQIPKLMQSSEKRRRESIKTPTYLQVPTATSGSNSSGGGIKGAISRLVSGSWSGWGSKNRQESFKRWQSESIYANAGEPADGLEVNGLSMCADLAKIDRAKLAQSEFTIIEFDGDTFQLLIEYLHSGSCRLTCETVPGLICAAEHFDLPDLLQACFHHTKTHMRLSVCPNMLNQLENYYWRYNSASQLVNTIFKFVDPRATKFFLRSEYLTLSESMFTSLISRPTLSVTECQKFQVMLRWATQRVVCGKIVNPDLSYDMSSLTNTKRRELQIVMNRLTRDLKLHKIPPQELITVSNWHLYEFWVTMYFDVRWFCHRRRSVTSESSPSSSTRQTLASTFALIDRFSEVLSSHTRFLLANHCLSCVSLCSLCQCVLVDLSYERIKYCCIEATAPELSPGIGAMDDSQALVPPSLRPILLEQQPDMSSAEVTVPLQEPLQRKDSEDSGTGDMGDSGKKSRRQSSDASSKAKKSRKKGKKIGKRCMAQKKNCADEDDDTELEDNGDDEEEFEWPIIRPERERLLPQTSAGHEALLNRFRARGIITEEHVYDVMMKLDFTHLYHDVKDEWVEHNAVIIERTFNYLKPGFRILLSPLNLYYAVILAILVGDKGGVISFGHYGNIHTLKKAGLEWMLDDYRLRFTNNRYELFYGKPSYEEFLREGFPKGAPYDMIIMTDQPLNDLVLSQLKHPDGIVIRPDIEDYVLHPTHLIPSLSHDSEQESDVS